MASQRVFSQKKRQKAVLCGSGEECDELMHEINNNSYYDLQFVAKVAKPEDISAEHGSIKEFVIKNGVSVVVYDSRNEALKPLVKEIYELILSDVAIYELDSLYESIFDKVPIQHLDHHWFLENVTGMKPKVYDVLKRAMDIVLSLPMVLVFIILYPFVWLAIKIEGGGPVLIYQDRVGKKGEIFKVCKIRTMNQSDAGIWIREGTENKVTKVGNFLRKTRIDELPQGYAVLKGDFSFIGPRPDMVAFRDRLAAALPHYNIRTMATPGLSGWAQVNQDIQPQSIEENKIRLSYDFYYIKNRSFMLDVQIALRTIRTLLSRLG
jgi:lipopolysaccharide/colanic/teichoic acid biosynthesis glycosyltransferase